MSKSRLIPLPYSWVSILVQCPKCSTRTSAELSVPAGGVMVKCCSCGAYIQVLSTGAVEKH